MRQGDLKRYLSMCGLSHEIWVLLAYVQMPKIKAHADVSRGAKSTSILSMSMPAAKALASLCMRRIT